ncbi:uncharacterized membrane protein YheB (UPF0754 family) [Catalinimonas alkaloidigena]|uniref:DUF445 domain-containing protein n=1 Tax=Catalinimonas alkaloidigena TaxID=1075417 RepID=UPI0024061237|nr:DUF445 family protein [Catalinimonas alkaloidigena]MDF9796072.1 uncharacterized membrane protein YheB (UPF0754 family) [Catalinimonas alkaloidigena]
MIIWTLPIIAALTGYITNYIAIKMLFHPRKKVKVLFLEIQGIFPKRQNKLAEKLGKIVADELFSIEDVKQSLQKPGNTEEIETIVNTRLDDFLENRLPEVMPMLAMFMNEELKQKIKGTLLAEVELMLPELIDRFIGKIEQDVDVEKTVYEKVVNFSTDKLESILYSIMSKEFKFIEILGGVLGFMIGLIQIAILQLQ